MSTGSVVQLLLPSFALCALMVAMLSYLGIHVIKRQIIFVDLALAQIAALGALLGLVLGIPLHTLGSDLYAVGLTVIAAAMFSIFRTRESRVPQEALIGLTYAIAAGTTIIIIDKAPHGAEHIKDILTGSILWVKWSTVGKVAAVYAVVGVFHYLFRKPFLLISEDPERAQARGMRVRGWDFLFYLSFGVVITVTVGSAGVLLVFVFLVAPAVMATLITPHLTRQLLVGWGLGLLATAGGLIVSYLGDLSSGPVVIGAYAVALLAVSVSLSILRASDRAAAARTTLATAAAFILALGLLFVAGRWLQPGSGPSAHTHVGHDLEGPAHAVSVPGGGMDLSPDPGGEAALILEELERTPRAGAERAVRFLEGGPPAFYAQRVLAGLEARLEIPSGYDLERPPSAAENHEALAAIRRAWGLAEEE